MTATTGPAEPRARIGDVLRSTEATLAAIAIAGFVALAATTHGNLLHGDTLRAVLQFLAVPILVGLAQMVVLGVGQMNLSVGVTVGLCSMIAAWMMVQAGLPAWLAVAACVLVGAAIGAANGLLVILTRINGFIVTLATMTVIDGLRYGIDGSGTYQGYSPTLVRLGQGSILGVPNAFLVAVVVAVLVAFFFRRAALGRRLLATGGNPVAARLSGISNDRSLVVAHTLSGLLAGFAGAVELALSGSVNATIGDDLLLPSFAAPIIGGVALVGGAVSVLGTCLAALIVRLVDVAQAEYSIDPSWVNLIVGAVVLGAVLLTQLRARPGTSGGRARALLARKVRRT
jgi:ribose transport system permease protein